MKQNVKSFSSQQAKNKNFDEVNYNTKQFFNVMNIADNLDVIFTQNVFSNLHVFFSQNMFSNNTY